MSNEKVRKVMGQARTYNPFYRHVESKTGQEGGWTARPDDFLILRVEGGWSFRGLNGHPYGTIEDGTRTADLVAEVAAGRKIFTLFGSTQKDGTVLLTDVETKGDES